MPCYQPLSSLLQSEVARVSSRIVRWGVGRGDVRLRCRVRTPLRKIRAEFDGYKHTSLTFLVVTFYELRFYGVLGSSGACFVL